MSEMSAEKKKEIERYIIKSYFSGGKNVESFVRGADIIKGTDDGYIPQLIVEVTYFGGSGDVMINWDIYDDEQLSPEWKNSFALRVCKERTIEKNRCDSVDAMSYAWEAWRERIQGKLIFLETSEKDKNCIEFSMHTMVLTHKPYQEDTEITITGMIPGRENLTEPNPFDSPCDVVMVPKREFERLQKKIDELRDDVSGRSTVIESYKRNIEKWQKATGCLRPEDISTESLISKSTALEQEVKILNRALQEWKDMTKCETPEAAATLVTLYESSCELLDELGEGAAEKEKEWRKATRCETPEAAATWITSYESACERGNKLAEEVESWQKVTSCLSPLAAKTLIDSGMSYVHAYHEVQKENRKLTDEVESWKHVTGHSTPEDYLRSRINAAITGYIEWQKATGCDTPKEAETTLRNLRRRLGAFIQAASCAERHLEHVLVWKEERTGQEVE